MNIYNSSIFGEDDIAKYLFNHSNQGIIICSKDNKIIAVNKSFTEITGYTPNEALGKNPSFLSAKKQDSVIYKEMWQHLNTKSFWRGQLWNRCKNGKIYIESISIYKEHNSQQRYVALFEDCTADKIEFERLRHKNNHDQLTGLYNKNYIKTAIELSIEDAKLHGSSFLLAIIDVDSFKNINNLVTQNYGDCILKILAEKIYLTTKSSDIVARLEADQFCVLAQNVNTPEQANIILRKINKTVSEVINYKNLTHKLTCSIGGYLYDDKDNHNTPSIIIHDATLAMDSVKERGGNGYQIFEEKINKVATKTAIMHNELIRAIHKGQINISYQPIINVTNGSEYRFEALARWNHPIIGSISPLEFIPVAEKNRDINELGKHVVQKVVQQLALWKIDHGLTAYVSINISPIEFILRNVAKHLNDTVREFGVEPWQIGIEVTESHNIHKHIEVENSFTELRKLGFKVMVDDFGTGYSSFAYLMNMPLDVLKIDKEFINNIENDKKNLSLVTSMIKMAHNLDLKVVAEGIENFTQFNLLKYIECDYLQGYFIGRPKDTLKLNQELIESSSPLLNTACK